MNIIPILPETIDIVTALDGGVRPEITKPTTYFVWQGEVGSSIIVTEDEVIDSPRTAYAMTTIYHHL